jgi:flagellar biosynthesis component FlhA
MAVTDKIKIGVCVMEKKVKCGSEVLSFFALHIPPFLLLLLLHSLSLSLSVILFPFSVYNRNTSN